MSSRNVALAAAGLLLSALSSACAATSAKASASPVDLAALTPAETTPSGEASADAEANAVLLVFFARWCPASRAATAVASSLCDRVRSESNAPIRCIAVEESDPSPGTEEIRPLATSSRLQISLDRGGALATSLDLQTLPSFVLLDRRGVPRYVHAGYHGDEDARSVSGELRSLLAARR